MITVRRQGLAVSLAIGFVAPAVAQDPVDDLLQALTVEQKAGQLFMSWSLSRSEGEGDANNHQQLLRWVEDVGLGGVILSLGTVDDAVTLIPQLQAKANVPLLLAGDFEGGVWFRLTGATELGNQMLVGASESERLARAMGEITGTEAKALGFHWVFAPVLDVNSNPQNPIINVRSFGEDPQLVARLGTALATGIRGSGLLACGKHFPGHGDVDSDSHLELPTVPGDSQRLHRVELRPFAAAAGVLSSMMTGHLAVPGLGEAANVPATLSHHILHDVLREELGFQGLIVTDALEMGGVKKAFPPGEVAVRALLAGADVLLMPPDPLAARQAVVDAVEAGRVPMARLDDAVRRILQAKADVGLLAGGGMVQPDWRQQLRGKAAVGIAEEIAMRGLVLVRDRDGVLPVSPEQAGKGTLLVTLIDQDEGQGHAFAEGLGGVVTEQVRLDATSLPDAVDAAVRQLRAATHVVIAVHVNVRAWQGGVGIPPDLQPVLDALRAEQQVAVVSFGNPYLLQHLPHADAYVAAFVSTAQVERQAALALRGQAPFVGRLPVTIPDVAEVGTGLTQLPGDEVPRALPEVVDLDPALAAGLRARLEQAIADRAFPGAVCVVARHGKIVCEVAVGHHEYDDQSPTVGPGTRYDLASLTKVCATTPAVLRLVAMGTLSLDDPVQKWLPAFQGEGKERVTVRHLLAHQGGLPAYERYFRTIEGKQAIVDAATKEGLMSEPGSGVTYSDLGFILLMAVVEAASGYDFEAFVLREVLVPFGMQRATFAPRRTRPVAAAPTEQDDARGGIVRGYVHDENAYAMGGISGHAGLFATAEDVARYGVAVLAGGRSVLPRDLVAMAIRPAGIGDDRTRGLGFQLLESPGYGGSSIPAGTFGHTGFTGTSLWCCPRYDLCVVLLSNRVHPTRVNNKITAVRRSVHDLVLEAVR